jgi:hypothetical protein
MAAPPPLLHCRTLWSGHKEPRTSSVSGAIVGLGSKIVSNLAALLRPGRGKSSVAGDLEAALAAIQNGEGEDQQPEAPPSAAAAPVSKRRSLNFGALFRLRSVDAAAGALSPQESLGRAMGSRCSMPGSGLDPGRNSSSTANPGAAGGGAEPPGGLRRRSSIDLVLSSLFGRRAADKARPPPQHDSVASGGSCSVRPAQPLLAPTVGVRLALASSLYSGESGLVAATASRNCAAHPLSGLSTARPSFTDAKGDAAAADLQARGAAAASAYLQEAERAHMDCAGVMSLCGGLAASAAQVPASFSLSGGMAGAPAAAAGSGLLSMEASSGDFGLLHADGGADAADAAAQAAAATGFESIWQTIQARTAPAPASAPAVQDAALAPSHLPAAQLASDGSSSSPRPRPVGLAAIGFQPPRALLVAGDAAAPSSANSSGQTTPASTCTLHSPWKRDGAASPPPCSSPTAAPPHPPAVNPRPHALVKRQFGLKAADMAADVEAALTDGPLSPAAAGVRGRGYGSASSPTSARQAAAVDAAAGAAAEPSASAGTHSSEQPGKRIPVGSTLTDSRQQAGPSAETAGGSVAAASTLFRPAPGVQPKQPLHLPLLGAAAGKAQKLEWAAPGSQPAMAAPSRGAVSKGRSSRALIPTSRASAEQLVSLVMAAAGGASGLGGARSSPFGAALDRAAGQRQQQQPGQGMCVSGSSSTARQVRRNSFSNDGSAPSGGSKANAGSVAAAAAAAQKAPAPIMITAVPAAGGPSQKPGVAPQARRLSAVL